MFLMSVQEMCQLMTYVRKGRQTVSMSRTVDMAIVAAVRFILDVRRVDGDTASFLFRRFIDLGIVREFCSTFVGEDLGDSCSQGRFSMVDMS